VRNFYSSNNNLFVLSLLRFLSANLLHAISSGIIGFGWFLKLVSKKNKYLYVGIFLGTLLHALYNILIVKLQGLFILLAICILFILMFIMIRLLKKIKFLTKDQNYESKLS
jgi:RsiW-degrading membrane proteinase PrsW (M82 family)